MCSARWLAALGEAHALGIIHRDLKPENIILEPLRRGGDLVKVLDFGLAKVQADAAGPRVTSPGIVCGTPDYMSPEQGRGDPLDGRSDLYAVGVILYQLLTGRLPFEAESPTAVVMMHLTLPVPDPRQVAPERDIPDPLVDVLFHSLKKQADQRYQDAIEFAEALAQALGDRPELARPSADVERACFHARSSHLFALQRLRNERPAGPLLLRMWCPVALADPAAGNRGRCRCDWSDATRIWPGS